MDDRLETVEYATVNPAQRAEALALLVSTEPPPERVERIATILTAIRSGAPAATLVGAWRRATLRAVAWGQFLPGNTGLVWPPRLVVGENGAVGDQLQELLDARLEAAGICMAQAILPDREHDDARRLERVGYEHVSELLYLVSPLDQMQASTEPFDIDFVKYTYDEHGRLAQLIERTYIDTLDVPALNGVRDMRDVLAGYEQTGSFSPDRWFFIRHRSEDVGCLLLNDHPLHQQWELVYLGIVPDCRGHGWGRQATRFAQQLAKDAGQRRLILAVDAANDPAVNAYTEAGFLQLLRRSVFLRVFAK